MLALCAHAFMREQEWREERAKEKEFIAAHQLLTWSGNEASSPETRIAWVLSYDSLNSTYVYVPAAAVYPTSQLNADHLFHVTSAGLAIGTAYHELLAPGLRSALAYKHLRDLLARRNGVIELDAAWFASDQAR